MRTPRKNKKDTAFITNDEGQVVEVSDVGVPGLFQPQESDIEDEFQNNEALREYWKELEDRELGGNLF